jgi:hypothetical protein
LRTGLDGAAQPANNATASRVAVRR